MAETNTTTCSGPNCNRTVLARGLCRPHYSRMWRAGKVEKKVRVVAKPCAFCGIEMRLRPSEAKVKNCCSRVCEQNRRSGRPLWERLCAHCHGLIPGRIDFRHPRNYCDSECYWAFRTHLAQEKAAMQRMGARARAAQDRLKAIVSAEVDGIRRISSNIKACTSICRVCDSGFVRKRKRYSRYCSDHCKSVDLESIRTAAAEAKKEYARAYRKANPEKRRAQKAARKARIRGAGETHNIDPIKVFDRDGWKCHICGIKTPKKHRGTYKDDAPELEHIISLADGGSHTWGNVACACRRCNISKGSDSYGQLGFDIAV